MKSIVYGPVPSWRLGRSLGVDLLLSKRKTCSFNCIYCQLGKKTNPLTERKEFVSLDTLAEALHKVVTRDIDYVTFSGMGEPTLASNLGKAITIARKITGLPVAVLTNSSLMNRDDVCADLSLADKVVAKIDSPNEVLFSQITRPYGKITLDEIIHSLRKFRELYHGSLALQIMFVEHNRDCANKMAEIAKSISPDDVQLNTPLRPCSVKPLPVSVMADIKRSFLDFHNVFMVYESKKPAVIPVDMEETLKRRPKL